MTVEEADVLTQLAAERGGVLSLRDMTPRNVAIAQRMSVATNYVRLMGGAACRTVPGREALEKHRAQQSK